MSKKYGLLDPQPLDEQEDEFLKCEMCGLEYSSQQDDEDYLMIEEYGRCIDCQEEHSDGYTDR